MKYDITVILDESGSMDQVREATISSFNKFIDEQKKSPGDGVWSLVKFNTTITPVYTGILEAHVEPLIYQKYVPCGATALLDAIGTTINNIGCRLEATCSDLRPDKVLVIIITDGQENSSYKYGLNKINYMIDHQKTKYSWEFVFLGANQDAIANACKMGINAGSSANYTNTEAGLAASTDVISKNLTQWKKSKTRTFTFSEEDRKELSDA